MITAESALLKILFLYSHVAKINGKDFCFDAIKDLERSVLGYASDTGQFHLGVELLRELECSMVIKKTKEGLSVRQISKEIGLSLATVYRILQRSGIRPSKQKVTLLKEIGDNQKLGIDFYSRLLKRFDCEG